TREERKASAIALANTRDAMVVVYGVIEQDPTTKQLTMTPEFYVSPKRNFSDALEMTGSLGNAKRTPARNSVPSQSVLSARVTALTYIVSGLSEHVLRNYTKALDFFQQSLNVPGWKDEKEGHEVLYALIGNTQLKLAEQAAQQCQRDAV